MTRSRQQKPLPPERPDSIAPITEKQLARLWQRRAARSRALRTEDGLRVRVLYPGRPGVTAGPDFRNALLLVEGNGLIQGDVEVHLRQRDWPAHGHHTDPNYNGVALHVSLETDGEPARTDSGATPPLVNLDALLDSGPALMENDAENRRILWAMLERQGYRRPESAEQMAGRLNRAGDERFLWKSRRLQMLLSRQSPEQTLWESICEALGYRHNQHPFLMLATSAPIGVLIGEARRLPEDKREPALCNRLLRLAGFDDENANGPQRRLPAGFGPRLEGRQWRLFRVRPSNHPKRRIKGAAALVAGCAEQGLAAYLARAAATGKPTALTRALTVTNGKPALIGAGRARDIAVNAVLPFLHGWKLLERDATGAAALLELYRDYGPLTDNEITRVNWLASLQEPGNGAAWPITPDDSRG